MVIDGRTVLKRNLCLVQFEGERIRLPVEIARNAKRPLFSGKEPIECWLLVVTPGRYRLIDQAGGTPSDDLDQILQQIEEAGVPGDLLDRTEDNPRNAIQGRLIPCRVSPPDPGWRINFPKEATYLVSDKEERSFVYVMIIAGFIEIWFPDTLRRAVSVPIAEILH